MAHMGGIGYFLGLGVHYEDGVETAAHSPIIKVLLF